MLRMFALATLVLNPPAYLLMREAAYMRHEIFKDRIEQDDSDLEDTWHQDALDWVYPI